MYRDGGTARQIDSGCSGGGEADFEILRRMSSLAAFGERPAAALKSLALDLLSEAWALKPSGIEQASELKPPSGASAE